MRGIFFKLYCCAKYPLMHRLMEEDRQKQMAEMKGSLMGMMPFSSGGTPGQAQGQAAPGGK